MKFIKLRKIYLSILSLLIAPITWGQIVSNNAFLQGDFVEVGISQCGSFGTTVNAPTGYHPRSGASPANSIGFVCDDQKDGWADYCGDYFLPGAPEEGFGIRIDGVDRGNYSQCTVNQITGSIIDYQNTATTVESTWQGTIDGIEITSRTYFPKDALYFVTQVTLRNTTPLPKNNVYYMRNLDPDNDQQYPGCGTFNTTNEILFQQPSASECRALVTSTGSCAGGGCFVGLGTKDDRARVSHGGFSNRNPQAVWDAGNAGTLNCGGLSGTGDCGSEDTAISLSFNLGNLGPFESTCLSFVYVLSVADLTPALDATSDIQLFAEDIDITATETFDICSGAATTLEIKNGCSYDWSWSPSTYLNSTSGPRVTALPTSDITYTVTGVSPCFPPVTKTVTLNIFTPPAFDLGINSSYCISDDPVTLAPSPVGGSLNINGTPSTILDPGDLGVGSHTAVYLYTDANGCNFTEVFPFTVEDLVAVDITGLANEFCEDASAVTLTGTPIGGEFTIDGNIVTEFDPVALGAGTHIVEYTYTLGCANSTTQTVTVHPLPTLATGLNATYCLDSPVISLTGSPSGGAFTINGNPSTEFNPMALGLGTHVVIYTYTDANSCTNTITENVDVIALPVVTITGLNPEYCVNDAAITLDGTASPAGGSFMINGVSATEFDPTSLGVGTHLVEYSFSAGTGCEGTNSFSVIVNPLPTLNFDGLADDYCVDAADVTLAGLPTGGTFEIDGVSATELSPSTLGVGTYTVAYTYTDSKGCTNTLTKDVVINPLPTLTFTSGTTYCLDSPAETLSATPAGGSFTVNGNPETIFNPASLGLGTHVVTYTYTDPNNCTNTITENVDVISLPVVTINGLNPEYCANDPAFALTGSTPTGGNYTINGNAATSFDPNALGAGNHTVRYTFVAGTGCEASADFIVTVKPIPSLSFDNLKPYYCLGLPPEVITVTPDGGDLQINGTSGNIIDPAALGLGTYNISYTLTAANGCSNTISQTFNIIEDPVLEFFEVPDTVCPFDDPIYLSLKVVPSPPFGILMIDGVANDVFEPSQVSSGLHTVTYQDLGECTMISKDIYVKTESECLGRVFVPTAFTPNGDGVNDELEIFGSFFYNYDLRIYNRWGETVFYTENPEEYWDGKYRNQIVPGGYYVCVIRSSERPDSEIQEIKTKILVIR